MNSILILTFFFGIIVGSFLNAVIHRLPRNINIAFPRSSCPNCGHIISWYENIPILSYFFLRGKCSSCESKISIEYPIVEIFSGIVALLMAPESFGSYDVFNFLFYFSIFCSFLVHFIVDLKHQILPDEINIFLGCLFLLISLFNFQPGHYLFGAGIGFGFPLLVSWAFYKLKGQIGLGGGDIKLYGVLGIYLGPIGIVQNIFLSCVLGSVVGLLLMGFKMMKRETPIPFGPFIIIVASFQIFAGKLFNELMRYIA